MLLYWVNIHMKTFLIVLTTLFLVGCSVPKNPKVSFGKKCSVQGEQVVWSHVWIYDKQIGLKASADNCKLIAD